MNIQSIRLGQNTPNYLTDRKNTQQRALLSSVPNSLSPLKTDSVSFNAKKPVLDIYNDTGNAKIDFLSGLEDYKGSFFVKEGKTPNILFVKIFDVPAFLEESKAAIDKTDKKTSFNHLIDSVINADDEEEDNLADESEEKSMVKYEIDQLSDKLEDCYDEMFDKSGKFQLEKSWNLMRTSQDLLGTEERLYSLTEESKEVPNFVTKFIDKEYGAVAKIELPESIDLEVLTEIKFELNDAQLNATTAALTTWLASQKQARDSNILNPSIN